MRDTNNNNIIWEIKNNKTHISYLTNSNNRKLCMYNKENNLNRKYYLIINNIYNYRKKNMNMN